MAKKKVNTQPAQIRLDSIDLMDAEIKFPSQDVMNDLDYNDLSYNLSAEMRIAPERFVTFITRIEVSTRNSIVIYLGKIVLACTYEIKNFNEVVKTSDDGQLALPDTVAQHLAELSVHTTRGYMTSFFRGSILERSLLPLTNLNPNLNH